jgi:hypothetical protein
LIETYVFKAVSSTSIGLGTYSGIVVRGIFFKILKCFNPSLATKVHEQRTLSPYSISPLENTERSQVFFDHVPGGLDFQFRIVAFQKDISEAVKRFVLSGDIPRINIHGITLPVNSVHVNSIEHDFSEKASSESTRFMVEFRSPTFFRNTQKRQGLLRLMIPSRFRRPVRPVYRYIIVPDPYYFFRGLARLYRQFCNPHFRYKSYCEWLLEGGVALETYYDLRVVKIWPMAPSTAIKSSRSWRGAAGATSPSGRGPSTPPCTVWREPVWWKGAGSLPPPGRCGATTTSPIKGGGSWRFCRGSGGPLPGLSPWLFSPSRHRG